MAIPWQSTLPQLTTTRSHTSVATFKKRKTVVISPWAWRKLSLCLAGTEDLLDKVQEVHGEGAPLVSSSQFPSHMTLGALSHTWAHADFLEGVSLSSTSGSFWPATQPVPESVTVTDLSRICATVVNHTKAYFDLLQQAVQKAQDSDDARLEGKLDEWDERLAVLEELICLAGTNANLACLMTVFEEFGPWG